MTKTRFRSTEEIRAEMLERDPEFRAEWERTALARAVALAVVGYRAKHQLSQTKLAARLGVRQPQVARLELGEHTPSIEMLQRLARHLGLRFIVEIGPATGSAANGLTLPPEVEVREDITTNGSHLRIATG